MTIQTPARCGHHRSTNLSCFVRTLTALSFAVMGVSASIGCEKDGASKSSPVDATTTSAPNAAPVEKRTLSEISIKSANGDVLAILDPDDGAFRVRNAKGEKTGKMKIEADRVKYKDANDVVLAKVKCKDGGAFKMYAGEDDVVAKVKRKGARVNVSNDAGSAIAEGTAGALQRPDGKTVTTTGAAGTFQVTGTAGGAYVVSGADELSTSMMGLEEIPLATRLATVAFLAAVDCGTP